MPGNTLSFILRQGFAVDPQSLVGPTLTARVPECGVKEARKRKTLLLISSSRLRYYKVTDPAGWVNVDMNSGELMVANTIDREAPHVVQGLYNITMRAVDASK